MVAEFATDLTENRLWLGDQAVPRFINTGKRPLASAGPADGCCRRGDRRAGGGRRPSSTLERVDILERDRLTTTWAKIPKEG
jgi:hypothetical protein